MADAPKTPELISETQPFWDGAAANVLMLKRCVDTGRHFYYPRERSPFTGGATQWTQAVGRGVVYSCSVAMRPTPNCLAYVRLEEGPIVLTNIVADDLRAVAIGDPVEVSFRQIDGGVNVPVFNVRK